MDIPHTASNIPTFSRITKRFGERTILDDISFTVGNGEFLVLLGPSGSGKSTLLKILSGIERPDNGSITLNGRDLLELSSRERNVGMVFQDYGLYPGMNVYQNIAYGLEARKLPRAEIDARVRDAAERLRLSNLLDRNINDLSGGEQQRVALARVLARDADLYLFDEPISNLDPKLRAQARRDIQMLHRMKGKPSIYVTHDQNEALAMADRLAILHNGRLQQIGTPEELLTRPANVFVAGFLGSPPMNILIGKVLVVANNVIVQLGPGCELMLSSHSFLARYAGMPVQVGIPPAAIYLADAQLPAEAHPAGQLNATIETIEPLIGEVVAWLRLPHQPLLAALFRDVDERRLQPGRPVTIVIDQTPLCWFDHESGQALI